MFSKGRVKSAVSGAVDQAAQVKKTDLNLHWEHMSKGSFFTLLLIILFLIIDQGLWTENKEFPIICYFALDADWPDNGTLHPALNATLCKFTLSVQHCVFLLSQ